MSGQNPADWDSKTMPVAGTKTPGTEDSEPTMPGQDFHEQKTMVPPREATNLPSFSPSGVMGQRPAGNSDNIEPTVIEHRSASGDERTVMQPSGTRAPGISGSHITRPAGDVSKPDMPTQMLQQTPTPGSSTPGPSQYTAGGTTKPSKTVSKFSESKPGEVDLSGEKLGGYQISKMLGHGGMGSVALARQMSLDRDVALKILPGKMAKNADFLMRFTREALSAAQLTHHNIVQVYDIGSDNEIHYISMEFVKGSDLGKMVRKEGKLAPDDAAAYVLQAARGLKYAHERGIIHRDIKPDNIMLNEQGVVKIADMGLAKIVSEVEQSMIGTAAPSSQDEEDRRQILHAAKGDITMADVAMGTPSYMAPEQGRDASTVDARADQYSLGCTLYYLISGTAPYKGKTAMEIISKHQMEPLTPVEAHVKHVPDTLSKIIRRMLEKNPQDRYPTLEEAIKDLEAYLGIESNDKGAYTPREQHLQVLEAQAKRFYQAPALKQRKMVVPIFFAVVALLTVILIFAKEFAIAGGILGMGAAAVLTNFVLNGIITKGLLFRRARSVFFGMTMKGWLAFIANVALAVLVLLAMGMLVWFGVFAVVGAGLAVAYQTVVAKKLRAQRAEGMAVLNDMLKQLRVRGVGEEALQDFVCRFAGDDWEELFEELFGYEDMVLARGKWAKQEKVRKRKKYATWRDPMFRWLEGIEDSRRKEKEQKALAKAEKNRLKEQGMSEEEAAKKSEEVANNIMDEGLLQPTLIMTSVSQTGAKKYQDSGTSAKLRIGMDSFGMANVGFRIVRFLLGGGLAAFYALLLFAPGPLQSLPGFLQNLLGPLNFANIPNLLGLVPFNIFGLIAGALLAASAISHRIFFPILTTLGAVLLCGFQVIPNLIGNPDFNPKRAFFSGLALLLVGFAMPFVMRAMYGKK